MIRRLARSLVRSPHVRLFAVMAVAALAGKALRDAATMPEDLPGLAAALGDDLGGCVDPASVRWEPSRGDLADVLFGRSVLFLATGAACDDGPQPRDLFRGRVRVTPEGRLLDIAGTYNLTSTPLGDDHALVVRGQRAAFATNAYGQEQSVTALDLSGEGAQATSDAWQDRAMGYLTNLQETGSGAGVARIDVALDEPARAVGLSLSPTGGELAIELASDRTRKATLDLDRADLSGDVAGMHAEAARHLPKRFVFWAVDTVRAVPWIGPAPIAWLEEKTFWVRDQMKQLAFRFHGDAAGNDRLADANAPGATTTTGADAPAARLDAAHAADGDTAWPPAPIASMWKTPEVGEGVWVTPQLSWMRTAIAGAPPAFFRTFVRPDPDRPYTRVLLVAMDMRQLDLDMEAGVEDPKPLTGPHGSGRLPRDPAIYTRVMAAFNGAFKTEHGNYGMMVHKRVLLPPQPGAASVVTLGDGRVGFGSWGDTKDVGGLVGIADDDIQSFRQNMDPLVDHGVVNPTGRALWGYTLPGNGMQTERSALCVTTSGNVMYAWGDDVSATALGKAMASAGCNYAMHLDMNPHHTGFIFSTIHELKGHDYRSELLTPLMEVSPDRYIEYSPKDFFYMMARDPAPPPLATAGGSAWQVDEGTQPAPSWLPGVWKNEQREGGVAIVLTQLEPGRARFRLRAGGLEPDGKTGSTAARELDAADVHSVLLAAPMGTTTDKVLAGLEVQGKRVLPFSGGSATAALVASAEGALSIVTGERGAATPGEDAAEVPLLFDGPQDRPAVAGAPAAKLALGITADERVILAQGMATSYAPLTRALRAAGCVRAVALDRGAHAVATIDRTGTAEPPRARYDGTVLYALAETARPRAFRFDAAKAVADIARGKIAP